MCGLAGVLHRNGRPAAPILVRRMINAIAHRGPDDEGLFVDGTLGFGHRRLAILDLTPAAAQPMQSACGRYVIVYNGELYNFHEIRRELEARGRRFRSRSDTEVMVEAFAEWGPDVLPRFNGMFAFAIWDRRDQALTLARDRFGVKPLYYVDTGTSFLFASEVKAILAHPDYRVGLDLLALQEYFTFQNFFTDRTLFEGVHLLPAGTWTRVDFRGAGRQHRYWDFTFGDDPALSSEQDAADTLQQLFEQAVNRQLLSDVPVASYLSGGMDSGSITAVAARQLPYMRTFTVGFDIRSVSGLEIGFDEREAAEHMSYLFKTEHYEMVLKAGDMERCMSDLVWHLEEPRVGQSYPNFYAAKLASRFNKVVLAGTGGDEILGGYPWRYFRADDGVPFADFLDAYYGFWQRLLSDDESTQVLGQVHQQVGRISGRDLMGEVFQRQAPTLTSTEDYVNHSLYLEAKTFLQGLLLVEDKLSMAYGLETRVPFLDNDLVDFAQRIPVRFKVRNLADMPRIDENIPGKGRRARFLRTKEGKMIMRLAMAELLPAEILTREKQGFSAPDASWFRGESVAYVRRLLLDRNAQIYDFLDRDATQRLINQHLSGAENRRLLIWSLLYFEEWCRHFLRPQSTYAAAESELRSEGTISTPPIKVTEPMLALRS